jgi:hypothetical protein
MTALIIDTISIQSYIFGSNKLKENIGGSYIIESLVYWEMIPLALKEAGICTEIAMCEWRQDADLYKLKTHSIAKVEIGYIGGGNAFLIFRNSEDTKEFVKSYSRLLLEYFPGLKTAYGLQENFDYQEGEAYRQFRKKLNENLIQNRSFSATQVLPFKHGIIEDCPWTNESQEVESTQSEAKISKMAESRIRLVGDAQQNLESKFSSKLGELFSFTNELEELGQPDDKGYIAIVHADGNGMGQKFIDCQNLAETRKLSVGIARYADDVMMKLVGYITNDLFGAFGTLSKSELWRFKETIDGKCILPIRPLIIGGDDITFVCEGRLGVHLAEKLLEFMTSTPVEGTNISACAGVAVVHTKSPFYKAYQLCEELTKKAKDASRPENDSWLHFMISTGGFSGSYESIIQDHYTLPGKRVLKAGPYKMETTLNNLKNGMRELTKPVSKGGWPRNKLKNLRDILHRDEAHQNYFLAEIDARNLKLPGGNAELWNEHTTPYYDMIELLDFYPQELFNHEL